MKISLSLKIVVVCTITIWMLISNVGCASIPNLQDTRIVAPDERSEAVRNSIWIFFQGFGITAQGDRKLVLGFDNPSQKTIKYVSCVYTPYNRVGDVITDNAGSIDHLSIKFTGPMSPGIRDLSKSYALYELITEIWDVPGYKVREASSIELFLVKVEYTDGSEIIISGDDLKYVVNDGMIKVDLSRMEDW